MIYTSPTLRSTRHPLAVAPVTTGPGSAARAGSSARKPDTSSGALQYARNRQGRPPPATPGPLSAARAGSSARKPDTSSGALQYARNRQGGMPLDIHGVSKNTSEY